MHTTRANSDQDICGVTIIRNLENSTDALQILTLLKKSLHGKAKYNKFNKT